MQYEGPRTSSNCRNLVSAYEHESELQEKISKELNLGRIAGPFLSRPLPNLKLSPIGIVPKKKTSGSSWRLIQHLSHPLGRSVNDYIDPAFTSVQYTSFDKVLETIGKLGKSTLLAKMDVLSAFRLLIIHPDDFELFGFKFKGKFYIDKCLPMGCSASCALFEKFATFIEWTVRYKSRLDSIEHYLDDFLFAGKAETEDCKFLMSVFRQVCNELGVPIAEEKTVGPTCVLIFLGLEIDTEKMVIRIPADKLDEVREKLLFVLNRNKVTLRELQSLVGLLNFCARAIPTVRAFNRRFCDAMCGIVKPDHYIRVTRAIKDDIEMWLTFLSKFNGTCKFGPNTWLTNYQLNLFTDSAGNAELGCGVFFSGHWTFFPWPESWKSQEIMSDITFLELVPILLSIFLFKTHLSNKYILFNTDNKALVSIINKKSSKSKRVMQLVRPFVLQTMLCNMQFKACHIEGRSNCIADAISRKQLDRFRSLEPTADVHPMKIPTDFTQLVLGMKLKDL